MSHSLETVYQRHRQGLFSLALGITRSRQSAEDAIHEAFVKLVARPLPADDLVAYVYRSVRNAAIDATRSQHRRNRIAETLFNGFRPDNVPETCPRMNLLTREREQLLRKAIGDLPDPQREIVILKAFAGLTFDQVALAVEIPAKTAATRYRRAIKKLESRLKGEL